MTINKVVYGSRTLIDLTGDTVSADHMVYGTTAHDKAGNAITGTIVLQEFRTGTSEPSDSVGNNGDLYFVTE